MPTAVSDSCSTCWPRACGDPPTRPYCKRRSENDECEYLPGRLEAACGVPRRYHDGLAHPFTIGPTPMTDERRFEIEASMSAKELREYMGL